MKKDLHTNLSRLDNPLTLFSIRKKNKHFVSTIAFCVLLLCGAVQKESVRQTNSGPVVTDAPLCHKLCYLFHLPSFSSTASSCPNMGASFCPPANQYSGLHPSWRWHGPGPGRRLQWGESNRLAGNEGHRQTRTQDRQTGKDREEDGKWLEAAAATSWKAAKKGLEVNVRKAEGR